MTKSVKLGAKQLEILTSIQNQKKQLEDAFKNVQDKEGILLVSILENAGISGQPNAVKLEGDTLVLEFKEEEQKKTRKRKEKEESNTQQ